MTSDAVTLDALKALRDVGLCTDPHHLNTAWADLLGKPRPQPDPDHGTPQTLPPLGPCARCSTVHQRYGEHGHPLCPDCRTHRPEQEIPT